MKPLLKRIQSVSGRNVNILSSLPLIATILGNTTIYSLPYYRKLTLHEISANFKKLSGALISAILISIILALNSRYTSDILDT